MAERTGSALAFVTVEGITGGLILIAYFMTACAGSIGMLTEAAAVVTMPAGALCFWGELALAANAARLYLGKQGIYLSSIASGLVDVDAITLSMAELSRDGETLDLHTAARAIVLAAASNTLVKGGIVLSTGSAALRKVILPGLLMTLATAIGVVFML